jgi:SAM-dependent methyltransferase
LGLLSEVEYRLLTALFPHEPSTMDGSAYHGKSKLRVLAGADVFEQFQGKHVIDFGCGEGGEVVEVALAGASRAVGIDIRTDLFPAACRRAHAAGVAARCEFVSTTDERADIILTVDAFEHFTDPPAVLQAMRRLLKPDGYVCAVFGPTWYHPLGGHMLSVFPWAHLLFTEEALMRWRARLRDDGARKFGEVKGGLNQMTIRRFRRLAAENGFRVEDLVLRPIRRTGRLHNRLTQEFLTAVIRCRLVPV